jgi:hypothetical protein
LGSISGAGGGGGGGGVGVSVNPGGVAVGVGVTKLTTIFAELPLQVPAVIVAVIVAPTLAVTLTPVCKADTVVDPGEIVPVEADRVTVSVPAYEPPNVPCNVNVAISYFFFSLCSIQIHILFD